MKKRIVIKIGSSSIVKNGVVDYQQIINLAMGINKLRNDYDVLIVSSGAVALGKSKLKMQCKTIKQKQACAAVGQASLIEAYESVFTMYQMNVAQILLSHDDFDNRKRLINLENTIDSLFQANVIPIVNENDALAIEEIKVGDNDTLAAFTASLVEAKLLILCSDIDGLYDKNPNTNTNAKLLTRVENVNNLMIDTEGKSSSNIGTGGMNTKLKAAKIVCSMGIDMIIMDAKSVALLDVAINNQIGTYFVSYSTYNKYQGWMLYNSNSKGLIYVDEGAKNAILKRKSLLPSGITEIKGEFMAGSTVDIMYGNEAIAKGLTNYSSIETNFMKGKSLNDCCDTSKSKREVIHANNIVLIK